MQTQTHNLPLTMEYKKLFALRLDQTQDVLHQIHRLLMVQEVVLQMGQLVLAQRQSQCH